MKGLQKTSFLTNVHFVLIDAVRNKWMSFEKKKECFTKSSTFSLAVECLLFFVG